MNANSSEISSFKTTASYRQAKERMRLFFLRGSFVDPAYLRKVGLINKAFEVTSNVQIINILGFVLNKPMVDIDQLDAVQQKRLLQSGHIYYFKKEARLQLENVVKEMNSHQFELIPLIAFVKKGNGHQIYETVLIKVKTYGVYTFVDISGRSYISFENFLNTNKLPLSILFYPKDGIVTFDEHNEIVTECSQVGRGNVIKAMLNMMFRALGVTDAVGTMFAVGGLAIPSGPVEHHIKELVYQEMLPNSFEHAEVRANWLKMSANLVSFAFLGVAELTAKLEGRELAFAASQPIQEVAAANMVNMVNAWQQIKANQKLTAAGAICFCFREAINYENTERIMRNCLLEGILFHWHKRFNSFEKLFSQHLLFGELF